MVDQPSRAIERDHVASSSTWIGVIPELRPLLDAGLATRLEVPERGAFVHGRQLRHGVKDLLSEDYQRAVLDLAVPSLLTRNSGPEDSYAFTLAGLLATSRKQEVAEVVNAVLRVLKEKYDTPRGPTNLDRFSWDELKAASGLNDEGFALAEATILAGLLATNFRRRGAGRPIKGDFWVSDRELERTVKCEDVDDYLNVLQAREPRPAFSAASRDRRAGLTDHQRYVIDAIYDEFCKSSEWPPTYRLNADLHGRGIDYLAIEKESRHLFRGADTSRTNGNERTTLTFLGLGLVETATGDAHRLYQVVSYLAKTYLDSRGELNVIGGMRVATRLGLAGSRGRGAFFRLARMFTAQGSPFFVSASTDGHPPEKAEFHISDQFLRFTQAASFDDVVEILHPQPKIAPPAS